MNAYLLLLDWKKVSLLKEKLKLMVKDINW